METISDGQLIYLKGKFIELLKKYNPETINSELLASLANGLILSIFNGIAEEEISLRRKALAMIAERLVKAIHVKAIALSDYFSLTDDSAKTEFIKFAVEKYDSYQIRSKHVFDCITTSHRSQYLFLFYLEIDK